MSRIVIALLASFRFGSRTIKKTVIRKETIVMRDLAEVVNLHPKINQAKLLTQPDKIATSVTQNPPSIPTNRTSKTP